MERKQSDQGQKIGVVDGMKRLPYFKLSIMIFAVYNLELKDAREFGKENVGR